MKKRIIGCAVVCLFLAAMVSAQEWADEGQLVKMFVQDASGRLSFVDAIRTSTGEFVAVPGGLCNGGECATPAETVLSCPTSGGPTCKSDQVCSCKCVKNADGTWSAKNVCV